MKKLHSIEAGRTLCFMVLSLSQILQSFNMRSKKSIFKIGILTNSSLNKATLISILMVAIVLFIPPISLIFGLITLPIQYYFIGLLLSFIPTIIIEIFKAIQIIK